MRQFRVMEANEAEKRHCHTLITSTRVTYNAVGTIHCPILDVDVVFNARGFHHLLNDSDGTPRDIRERIYKLTLFPLAVPVVKNATAIAEERDINFRDGRKKKSKVKKAKTYTLVAKVGRKRPVDVKVVILKIGNGNYMFRSIMKD